jgi:23S rRNA pseudouridine2605 synthase
VTDETAARLVKGLTVGNERLTVADASVRKRSKRESHLTMTLTEGKNREIRRLLGAVEHPVTQLRRVQFGELELGTLPPGKWRRVSTAELRAAFPSYPTPSKRAPRPK